jgi:peptidyl-prolyl cis-trans isomerase C
VLRRALREPLVHFVVLGALVFGFADWRATNRGDEAVIVLGPDELAGLHADFERRTGEPPTPLDEQGLIDHFVDDEMLYREALRRGLDRGDVIVRRRLLQKMEFLLDARADLDPPTLADLQALRDADPARYEEPARCDLEHVFVDGTRHGDRTRAMATEIEAALRAGADPTKEGDPFIRGRLLRAQSRQDLARIFGPAFADAAEALPIGAWSDPIASSYGLHVVRVLARTPARLPDVAELEERLRLDWTEQRRAEVRRQALEDLRKQYTVRIDRGPAGQ